MDVFIFRDRRIAAGSLRSCRLLMSHNNADGPCLTHRFISSAVPVTSPVLQFSHQDLCESSSGTCPDTYGSFIQTELYSRGGIPSPPSFWCCVWADAKSRWSWMFRRRCRQTLKVSLIRIYVPQPCVVWIRIWLQKILRNPVFPLLSFSLYSYTNEPVSGTHLRIDLSYTLCAVFNTRVWDRMTVSDEWQRESSFITLCHQSSVLKGCVPIHSFTIQFFLSYNVGTVVFLSTKHFQTFGFE